jgi:hypothetical protein
MDPRPPVGLSPGFGPFDGEALQAELNRAAAAQAFRCVAAQIVIVLAACLSAGFFVMLGWHQLAAYDAALAACAGV